jgi:hypothetical protein
MKRLALSVALLGAAVFGASAQEDRGFYLKPTGSYFLKVMPVEFPNVGELQPRDIVSTTNGVTTTTVSERTITGSFGQGWRAGLTGGFRFNKNIAFELGFNYFQSDKNTMAKQTVNLASGANVLSLHSVGQVKAMDVMPTLVFYLPTEKKFKPYMKMGAVVPVGGYLEINTEVSDKTSTIAKKFNAAFTGIDFDRQERIKANPTIGFVGAAGFNLPIANKVSFFSELEYRNVSIGGKEKELTKFNAVATTPLGTTNLTLADLPKSTVHTNYAKKLDANSNVSGHAGFDSTKPSDDLRSYINIGGLGVNVGIKIAL